MVPDRGDGIPTLTDRAGPGGGRDIGQAGITIEGAADHLPIGERVGREFRGRSLRPKVDAEKVINAARKAGEWLDPTRLAAKGIGAAGARGARQGRPRKGSRVEHWRKRRIGQSTSLPRRGSVRRRGKGDAAPSRTASAMPCADSYRWIR